MVQYFMLAAVVTVLILAAITLNNVSKIKTETVPSVQTQNVTFDLTVAALAASGAAPEGSFTQPANSKILSIQAIPLSTLTLDSSGTAVLKAGIASAGATIVAGTTILSSLVAAANLPVNGTLIGPQYTSVARTVYVSLLTGGAAVTTATATTVRIVVRYEAY